MVLYISLAFFERPYWCYDPKYDVILLKIKHIYPPQLQDDCTGDQDTSNYIPRFSFPIFDDKYLNVLEIILVLFLTLNNWVKIKYVKGNRFRTFKTRACFVIVIFTIIWNFTSLYGLVDFRLTLYARVVFIILFKQDYFAFFLCFQ